MKKVYRHSSIFILIFLAAAVRLLPHPPNVTPIAAMCLFGGALAGFNIRNIIICFASLYLADFVLNNTILRMYYETQTGLIFWADYMNYTYLGFAGFIFFGSLLKSKFNWVKLIAICLGSSAAFFLITNFGSWAQGLLYPKTTAGLVACFQAAIPFFRSSLMANLGFAVVIFGVYQFFFVRDRATVQA